MPLSCPAPLYLWKSFRAIAKAIPGLGENRSSSRRNHCSRSARNPVRLHPGTLFAFTPESRSPSPGIRTFIACSLAFVAGIACQRILDPSLAAAQPQPESTKPPASKPPASLVIDDKILTIGMTKAQVFSRFSGGYVLDKVDDEGDLFSIFKGTKPVSQDPFTRHVGVVRFMNGKLDEAGRSWGMRLATPETEDLYKMIHGAITMNTEEKPTLVAVCSSIQSTPSGQIYRIDVDFGDHIVCLALTSSHNSRGQRGTTINVEEDIVDRSHGHFRLQ